MHVTGRSTAPRANTRSPNAHLAASLDCRGTICAELRDKGEGVSIDTRDPAHPQRLPSPRPPVPANEVPPTKPAPSDRRIGLTPITLLLVLVVGYLLIQIQFVLVLVLLSLVFATVIQTPVDALDRRHVPRPLATNEPSWS